MKTIRIFWSFYSSFAFVSIVINLIAMSITYKNGLNAFNGILWLKWVSFGLIYLVLNRNKKEEYYYYKNLGISQKKLWLTCYGLDFMLLLILVYLTLKLS